MRLDFFIYIYMFCSIFCYPERSLFQANFHFASLVVIQEFGSLSLLHPSIFPNSLIYIYILLLSLSFHTEDTLSHQMDLVLRCQYSRFLNFMFQHFLPVPDLAVVRVYTFNYIIMSFFLSFFFLLYEDPGLALS